ncbi:lysine 2,3-aminomutase, partial [Nguyenibacter vanlangensis]|nr:lysine 2,3-aminomutase [Nguyenibacter vanlangensis]
GRVTGLAWPTYTLDIPGGHGKVPLGPDYLEADGLEAGGPEPGGRRVVVRDPAGGAHKLAAESAANLALGARGR